MSDLLEKADKFICEDVINEKELITEGSLDPDKVSKAKSTLKSLSKELKKISDQINSELKKDDKYWVSQWAW